MELRLCLLRMDHDCMSRQFTQHSFVRSWFFVFKDKQGWRMLLNRAQASFSGLGSSSRRLLHGTENCYSSACTVHALSPSSALCTRRVVFSFSAIIICKLKPCSLFTVQFSSWARRKIQHWRRCAFNILIFRSDVVPKWQLMTLKWCDVSFVCPSVRSSLSKDPGWSFLLPFGRLGRKGGPVFIQQQQQQLPRRGEEEGGEKLLDPLREWCAVRADGWLRCRRPPLLLLQPPLPPLN